MGQQLPNKCKRAIKLSPGVFSVRRHYPITTDKSKQVFQCCKPFYEMMTSRMCIISGSVPAALLGSGREALYVCLTDGLSVLQ